jgi:tRNA G18 (ribose-2'-O)-methylase SpoU
MHKGPRVVAVGLQRPDNIGMLFRIADAVGVQELVFVDSPHITGRKVRRVSRHTQDAIPHRQLSSAEFLAHAARYEPLIALEITTHSQDLYTTDLPHDLTLVVGNERHGIPAAILAVCQRAVHIPMLGQNSSMNVATAAGIALYEWHRRYRLTE